MKFHALKDAPIRPGDVVFRESWINKLIGLLCGTALVTGLAALAVHERSWLLGLVAAFFGLFVLIFFKSFLRTIGPQNWALRCRPSSLLVKFRSYQHCDDSPADVVVCELEPGDIESVGRLKERIARPGHGRQEVSHENITYLEIRLAPGADLEELLLRLKEEHARKHKSALIDIPVHLAGDVLRINWLSGQHWVTPGVKKAQATLASLLRVKVADYRSESKDLASDPGRAREREYKILELAESGERIAAVKLAREFYGFSLAEAKDFVDELTGEKEAAE